MGSFSPSTCWVFGTSVFQMISFFFFMRVSGPGAPRAVRLAARNTGAGNVRYPMPQISHGWGSRAAAPGHSDTVWGLCRVTFSFPPVIWWASPATAAVLLLVLTWHWGFRGFFQDSASSEAKFPESN